MELEFERRESARRKACKRRGEGHLTVDVTDERRV